MKGLYVHFPFCKRICLYCDFYKIEYNEDIFKGYLKSLYKEFGQYKDSKIDTIYLGGGSPSILGDELTEIVCNINKNFKLNDPEFTIEINPADVNIKAIKLWKKNGINRVSLGCQSFNNELLKKVGRFHTCMDNINTFNMLRDNGFNNINIDLIFGFPGQSKNMVISDLKTIINLSPEHVSFYLLTWHNKELKKMSNLKPSEEIEEKMYYEGSAFLVENGYEHYEISNFSKIGFQCRHNLKYWNMEEWIGTGAGGAGFYNGKWYKNTENIKTYIQDYSLAREIVDISNDDRIIMGLRTSYGINKSILGDKLSNISDDFFILHNDNVSLKEKYWFVSNNIISDLLSN